MNCRIYLIHLKSIGTSACHAWQLQERYHINPRASCNKSLYLEKLTFKLKGKRPQFRKLSITYLNITEVSGMYLWVKMHKTPVEQSSFNLNWGIVI